MLWDRDNRQFDDACLLVESTIAAIEHGSESDVTACIEKLRSGQYALAFWPMNIASAFENPSEGDLRWAADEQWKSEESCKKFGHFLFEKEEQGVIDANVPSSGAMAGRQQFIFDSLAQLGEMVDEFRLTKNLPAIRAANAMKEGAARA